VFVLCDDLFLSLPMMMTFFLVDSTDGPATSLEIWAAKRSKPAVPAQLTDTPLVLSVSVNAGAK
jgi:hypothetical protein